MGRIKLAIVSTHPIQYYAPVFRALAGSDAVEPRVFFTWSQTAEGPVFDPGFGTSFSWDVPLRDGYDHVFVPNTAKEPGSSRFGGIRNPTLTREISAWGADAVLVYGWNLHSHLHALRHFKRRIPVLFRGDSTLLDRNSRLRSLMRRLWLRWVYSHVDMAVAVGQNNRDYYIGSGVRAERIAFAPHSIDTARFKDSGGEHESRARRWRRQLGISDDAVAFVFAAKLIAKKDPMLLLDAFIRLASRSHLVLVGDGELACALRERAAANGNVHFLPFQNQSDMPSVYRLGDAFVLPSRGPGETWGLALNEAMASGRPVICGSRVGAARDLVNPGVTGWVFESANREDLSRALTAALRIGRDGLRRMGEAAQAASELWSTEAAARGIAAAVTAACISRRPGRR